MLNTNYLFTHYYYYYSFFLFTQTGINLLGVKHQLPIYSFFFFFLLFLHPDRYHQVNSVLNTNYLFTHYYYYYSFFLFTQTGINLLGVKHQLPIYSFFFFFLLFLHPDRYHQVNSVLNTNYLFTHSSSFFLFTQTGTTRSTRC